MTTNPTLVKSISIIPGLSDHDVVRCVIDTKPKQSKQPPRKAYLYRKADWESFWEYMKSFCDSFVNTIELKSIEEIWQDLKGAIEQGSSNFIPTKQISGRKNLPWITQSIKRGIRKRDHLYQKYKKSKNPADKRSFLNCKHAVKKKLKQSHDNYFEDILDLNSSNDSREDSKSTFSRKKTTKLFSVIKNSKQDNQGIPLLKKGELIYLYNNSGYNQCSQCIISVGFLHTVSAKPCKIM